VNGLYHLLLLAALALVAALLLFAAFARAHLRYWVRRLTLPLEYSTREILETGDGSRIELRQVPVPAGVVLAALPPVLLVHGIGANHRNNDLQPNFSLARHLAALGRDVWLLTLRSGLERWTRAEALRVRFAAMVQEDLPLAVSTVLARTGAAAVDYVGFSMGGMLLYAALGRTVPAAHVRRAVMVGSPGRVGAPRHLLPLLRHVPRWLVPASYSKLGAHAFAFASEWVHTPIHRVLINPDNVTAGMTRAVLVNMVEDIPASLNADFLEWAVHGGTIRVDGVPALPGLADVAVPALFFAGTADRLAPPAAVELAFDAWGSARGARAVKRLVVLGRSHGYRADYGHGDLAVGTHASSELFEPIARFLGQGEPFADEGAASDLAQRSAVGCLE
jgi:polyhydroxyalkanoate synthase subunit PhaC